MKKPLIYGLIGLAVIIIIIVVVSMSPSAPTDESNPNVTSTETGTPNTNPTTNPPSSNPPNSGTQAPKPATNPPATKPTSQSISITSPSLDARFDIGSLNTIKWSREPGIIAGLYLVDATTNTTIGWITPTITAHQTSYTWDAKDVAVSRQSGIKKSITPGKYYMKMKFDGPISEATSNTFYLLYPQQDTAFAHNLTIQSFKFIPASVAVRIGEKITIQNKDSNTYTLTPKNFGEIFTIAPGETKTILTGSYPEGQQGFYSQQHSVTNLSIDIYK